MAKEKAKPLSPDAMSKTGKRGQVELKEEQLDRVAGGFGKKVGYDL